MRSFVLKCLSILTVLAFGAYVPAYAAGDATVSAQATANVEHFELEKPHTQIVFIGNHLGFSHSYGRFMDFDGEFTLDHDDLSQSAVNVVIDAASLDMGHEKWNAHLQNEDFLDVEKFPEIRFTSDAVTLVDEKTAQVSGVLSMHGIDKQVTLDVTHNKSGVHPFNGKYIAGFSAEATIRRSDFGMTFGLPLLADEVVIKISVEGIRRDENAADDSEKNTKD